MLISRICSTSLSGSVGASPSPGFGIARDRKEGGGERREEMREE